MRSSIGQRHRSRGSVSLNAGGIRHLGTYELHAGVLTVTAAGKSVSVCMPDDCVITDSAARILLRRLIAPEAIDAAE
jgi:hypothetical protein